MKIFSFFKKKPLKEPPLEEKEIIESLSLEIDISAIEESIAYSNTSNALAIAFRKHGINALVSSNNAYDTDYIYEPVNFSDHWKFFINSKKVKPKKLEYLKLRKNK